MGQIGNRLIFSETLEILNLLIWNGVVATYAVAIVPTEFI
jgi:hypothetical protein